MYLWLKLYTVPFFVSGQTYKISKGSNNYCSHCIEYIFENWPLNTWMQKTEKHTCVCSHAFTHSLTVFPLPLTPTVSRLPTEVNHPRCVLSKGSPFAVKHQGSQKAQKWAETLPSLFTLGLYGHFSAGWGWGYWFYFTGLESEWRQKRSTVCAWRESTLWSSRAVSRKVRHNSCTKSQPWRGVCKIPHPLRHKVCLQGQSNLWSTLIRLNASHRWRLICQVRQSVNLL